MINNQLNMSFPGGSDGKESACDAGDLGLISELGRSAGEGKVYPLQYSCLDNPMDREAWRATVRGVAKSRTQMSHEHISSRLPKAPLILPPKTWEILLTKVFFCKEPEEHSVKSISRLVEFKSVTRAARLHFHHVRPLAV